MHHSNTDSLSDEISSCSHGCPQFRIILRLLPHVFLKLYTKNDDETNGKAFVKLSSHLTAQNVFTSFPRTLYLRIFMLGRVVATSSLSKVILTLIQMVLATTILFIMFPELFFIHCKLSVLLTPQRNGVRKITPFVSRPHHTVNFPDLSKNMTSSLDLQPKKRKNSASFCTDSTWTVFQLTFSNLVT